MSSYDEGKIEVVNYVYQHFAPGSTCLDVGACDGKWYDLLGHYLTMDAVEIFGPNIKEHRLKDKYRRVWECDAYDFRYDWYDLIILGDVLEHMTVERAQTVLERTRLRCRDVIIGVPFLYKQDAIYDNPYERHIQDDLTLELFNERYPGHTLLIQPRENYAYFHRENPPGQRRNGAQP